MDGVVIHLSAQNGPAIIWCDDHGKLALLERENLAQGTSQDLAVGDRLSFDVIADGEFRICGLAVKQQGQAAPALAHLLRSDSVARHRRSALRIVPSDRDQVAEPEFTTDRRCG